MRLRWALGIIGDLGKGFAREFFGGVALACGYLPASAVEAARQEGLDELEDLRDERNALARHLLGFIEYVPVPEYDDSIDDRRPVEFSYVCGCCADDPHAHDCRQWLAAKELEAMGFAVPRAPAGYVEREGVDA